MLYFGDITDINCGATTNHSKINKLLTKLLNLQIPSMFSVEVLLGSNHDGNHEGTHTYEAEYYQGKAPSLPPTKLSSQQPVCQEPENQQSQHKRFSSKHQKLLLLHIPRGSN
jgi:hypothetical protein